MKILFKNLALLIIVMSIFGCSSESPTTTPTEVVKTKVKITKVEISSIPALNSGFLWDNDDAPDVYIKCYDELGTLAGFSSTIWNRTPTINSPNSIIFTPPMETTDLTNTILTVHVWEDDSDNNPFGVNPDDKIGEVPFNIHDYTIGSNKYPSYALKSNGLGTIVTIFMTWE